MTHAQPGPRFGTARLATGPALHYAEQGDPGGEAVLFIHGWPDSWFSFSRVLPRLPRRLHALVPDQRGFGDSDRPERGYSIDDLAGDAAAFLDAVGIRRATVVGHSMGSLVARRLTVAHPAPVARLVLIGSAPSALNDVTRQARAGLPPREGPIPPDFARAFQASTAHRPLPPDFFEQMLVESLKAPARVWCDVMDGILAFDDSAQRGRIAVPTLLLWGEHDALFPRSDQDALLATIPGAHLKVYPGTGHCPNWEIPEQVAADIVEFVRAAPGAAGG
jgi:pimeloyl-ACP methyl ester carboxylesterase